MSLEYDAMNNIVKRLDRLEECFARFQHLSLYKLMQYLESSEVQSNVELIQGMSEDMYEEQTGRDVITNDELNTEKGDSKWKKK